MRSASCSLPAQVPAGVNVPAGAQPIASSSKFRSGLEVDASSSSCSCCSVSSRCCFIWRHTVHVILDVLASTMCTNRAGRNGSGERERRLLPVPSLGSFLFIRQLPASALHRSPTHTCTHSIDTRLTGHLLLPQIDLRSAMRALFRDRRHASERLAAHPALQPFRNRPDAAIVIGLPRGHTRMHTCTQQLEGASKRQGGRYARPKKSERASGRSS